jgi:uncharacterized membrane protein
VTYLILGLIVFLGVHSIRIVAEEWRNRTKARIGDRAWKGLYALVSTIGFSLIVWGFGIVRQQPFQLWSVPVGMRHMASLLTLVSFVLLAAVYVPGNRIKAHVRHPMIIGVQIWALAHLVANANLGHVLLFGSFLVWSVLNFIAARARDHANTEPFKGGTAGATGISIALGVGAWVAVTLWLHGLLIGVSPLG